MVVPTVPYGVEAWGMRMDERRKLDVIEIEFSIFIEYVRSEQDGEIEERGSEAHSWCERKYE